MGLNTIDSTVISQRRGDRARAVSIADQLQRRALSGDRQRSGNDRDGEGFRMPAGVTVSDGR
jgi:hypothetical protein